MSGDRCPECHADWDSGGEHWHVDGCPRAVGDNHPDDGRNALAELDEALMYATWAHDTSCRWPDADCSCREAGLKMAQRIRDLFARLERERDEWQEVAEAAGRRLAAFNATARDRRGEHG